MKVDGRQRAAVAKGVRMNTTFEQILLFTGLFFASLYFVILFVWVSAVDERDRVAIGLQRDEYEQ